ncbi:MAG: carboxylesterase family protein [Gammaproteobacteria bacterium]|nr:carboxylesterase family protein [Gammaproteobacteria bacterium]
MKLGGKALLIGGSFVVAVLAGAAALLHAPMFHRHAAALHGAAVLHDGAGIQASGPAATMIGESGGDPIVNARARDGVAAIGRRWDEAAFAETVALYTAVHRDVEWPGVLEPELFRYGPGAEQTFEVYRPEQEFSEPGPVFLFLHGNGLGNSDRIAAGSGGLIYSHLGKLGAAAGGIGVSMDYRHVSAGAGEGDDIAAELEAGAEDLRLVIEWIGENISSYGGDPDTIVVVANSEGATTTASYLFNEDWQTESGPNVAAAVLASGLFGSLVPAVEQLASDYEGERVPLALWTAEYDTAEVADGIADLRETLCRKYDGCPWTDQLEGHNHVSHVMSLGTADTDAMNSLIRFYHTVR